MSSVVLSSVVSDVCKVGVGVVLLHVQLSNVSNSVTRLFKFSISFCSLCVVGGSSSFIEIIC